MNYQICSITLTFDIYILDGSGDPLSSSDLSFYMKLENDENIADEY